MNAERILNLISWIINCTVVFCRLKNTNSYFCAEFKLLLKEMTMLSLNFLLHSVLDFLIYWRLNVLATLVIAYSMIFNV